MFLPFCMKWCTHDVIQIGSYTSLESTIVVKNTQNAHKHIYILYIYISIHNIPSSNQ